MNKSVEAIKEVKTYNTVQKTILPYFCGICTLRNPNDHAFLMMSCGYYNHAQNKSSANWCNTAGTRTRIFAQ